MIPALLLLVVVRNPVGVGKDRPLRACAGMRLLAAKLNWRENSKPAGKFEERDWTVKKTRENEGECKKKSPMEILRRSISSCPPLRRSRRGGEAPCT